MTFDASAPGTASALWEADDHVTGLPAIDVSGMRELVVVAAHPDDETLGCGGLIAAAADTGIPIHLIAVTDGAASHPHSPTIGAEQLSVRREEELREAAKRIAPAARVTWLGFPDGRTPEHRDEIAERLRGELATAGSATHVFVTWPNDGHRDHRVVGSVVEAVVPSATTLWNYPIWMWHWADPQTAAIPWDDASAFTMSRQLNERKQYAIGAFGSQVEAISAEAGDERVLHDGVLEHFARDREIFFAVSAVSGVLS